MENKTRKKLRSAGIFGVLPLVWAMGLSAAIPAAIGFWILFTTGPWGIPLFLTYLCLLMMPTAYLISRRENNNRRFLGGEEIYFSENPLLREKALRKKRKEGIPADVQQCLEALRKELPDLEEETDEACEKLQKRNKFLFFAAALLLLGLAVFLFWRGWSLYQAAPASSSQKTDFTPLFPLAGGVLVLATAICLFMKKKKKLLHLATTLVLIFGAWGSSVAVTAKGRIMLKEMLIGLGCAAFYALLVYGLLALAREVKSPAQARRDYQTLQLELFELGCLDEATLRFRLEQRKTI